MKNNICKWICSTAGKVSIVLIFVSIFLIGLVFSTYGESFLSRETANTINNILIGIATSLIGIVVTVLFVQYAFDKQDDDRKRRDEIMTINRYDKYMRSLIQKFLMFYITVTTRMKDRNKTKGTNPFTHKFKFSDIADMYLPSLYLSEGLLKPSIELFYGAEEKIREYMLKMLENIDFKYNTELEKILMDFVTKSVELDMRGYILGALKTQTGNEKMIDGISKDIANENYDWLDKFHRGELTSNSMLPYVIFYYSIQDQVRMIKEYMDYIDQLNC